MVDKQELQVQQKREVDKKTESTAPGRTFLPVTDIFETPDALTVVLEMPGSTATPSRQASRMTSSPSKAASITRSMRECSRSTPSTMWVTMHAALKFPTKSTRPRSAPR